MNNAIVFYNGTEIRKDANGLVNLNDLWVAGGSVQNKDPRQWVRLPQTIGFIEAANKFLNVGKSHIINMPVGHIIKSKRGKGGGTYGHEQIALEYAQYLSPELAVMVNQVFFERIEEEKNPDLILNRAVDTYKRKGKSDNWIAERLNSKATRIAFTGVLKSHGVEGLGYRNCTNAIYTSIFGGNATHVRGKKNLPTKSNTREFMSEVELATTRLAELLSANNIEKRNLQGNEACQAECLRTSKLLANSVSQSLRAAA